MDVVSLSEAKRVASEAGMDLVEVAPKASPPVCKVMDYGKFRYEQLKRQKEAKKKQKVIIVKEVKFRIKIEEHDFQVKAKNAKKFLLAGNRVKVTIMFRGRERSHPDLGRDICLKLAKQFEDICSVERPPKSEGRNMIMVLAPLPEKELQAYLREHEEKQAPDAEETVQDDAPEEAAEEDLPEKEEE